MPLTIASRSIAVSLLSVIAATLALSACGGSSETADPTTTTSPTTTVPASTTTTEPLTAPEALEARLAVEFDDAELAGRVVAAQNPQAIEDFALRVPPAEMATTPLLSYQPEPVPAGDVDSIVIYAFGYHDGPDGTRLPGPVNEDLATAAQAFLADHDVPVFAQQEVAGLLTDAGVDDVTSIDPVEGPDGNLVYLSTAGVAEQVVALAAAEDTDLGTVGVFGFADHVGRCVLTSEAAGMTGSAPEGVEMPSTYDPASAQPWTRDRETYLTTDLASRLAA